MPKFRFGFERTYTVTEGFDRIIEASSLAEAEAAAANLCREFNHDSPDDCSEIESGHTEIGGYEAAITGEEVHPARTADYIVDGDGQCAELEGS